MGCSSFDRLTGLGEPPPLAAIENPITKPATKPVHMPMPTPQPASLQPELAVAERLPRPSSRTSGAHQVGAS